MKRLIAVLMICFILCGCSDTAGEIFGPITDALSAPTEPPVIPPLPADAYVEGTAMVVKFEMGAEFEMLLNSYCAVLEVRGLNEAGDALLSSIEPTGSYRNAMEVILSEARNQTLLDTENLITITAREVGEDAWHVGCHNILTWPIENYAKTIGITTTFQMDAPGPYFDDSTYLSQSTFTRDDGDHTTTICYANNGYGPQEMDYLIYDNGDYAEIYYLTDTKEFFFCTYYVDGNFSFSYDSPTAYNYYTLTPDGSVWGNSGLRDEEGNNLRTTDLYEDGSYYDAYYENGNVVKQISIDPNGVRSESTFDEKGDSVYYLCEDPNGYRQEIEFFSNGIPKWSLTRNPDGSYSEFEYYESGMVKREYTCNADGSLFECEYHENGVFKRTYTCNADGSADEQNYDENGIPIDAPAE